MFAIGWPKFLFNFVRKRCNDMRTVCESRIGCNLHTFTSGQYIVVTAYLTLGLASWLGFIINKYAKSSVAGKSYDGTFKSAPRASFYRNKLLFCLLNDFYLILLIVLLHTFDCGKEQGRKHSYCANNLPEHGITTLT